MTDDPLDAMKARWSYIQGFLFPWMREDNDPITEALGRLVTTGLFSSQWRRGSWRMRLRSRAARQRAFRMFEPPAARIRL